jgi:hypothetical protein
MNKARLLLTAGLVAGIFAAGVAAATAGSDRAARDADPPGESHAGWRKAKADDNRQVPVRSHADWSRAYARTDEGRGYGYGYPGIGYAYGCVQTQWDPAVGYVRVRAPC